MKISVIIVNYQSELFLKKCLDSLCKNFLGQSYEIIIVNNDPKKLAKENFATFNNLIILEKNINNGFARACNDGARIAKGEFFFFLNPDTEIKSSAFQKIFLFLDNPEVGIVAPQLITNEGIPQPWSIGEDITLWSTLKNKLRKTECAAPKKQNSITEVSWVSGAALGISKKTFFACGKFDENFFMYFEDIDLCRQVQKQKKKILQISDFLVLHLGGQSYQDKQKQKRHYYLSQDYYFKKNFGIFSLFLLRLLRKALLIFKKN